MKGRITISARCLGGSSLALVLLMAAPGLLSPAKLLGQLVKQPLSAAPAANSTPEAPQPSDLLGRDTPHGSLLGFLKYSRRGDYATAARFLQAPAHSRGDLETRAQELEELMDRGFSGGVQFASDKPAGDLDDGLPPDRDRVGILSVNGQRADLVMVRVEADDGKQIWLISRETIADVAELSQALQPSKLQEHLPAPLTENYFLGIAAYQWIGWLLSIPVSYGLAWLLLFCVIWLRTMLQRVLNQPQSPWLPRLHAPSRFTVAVIFHAIFVYLLHIPLFYRIYYSRFVAGLLLVGIFWFAIRAIALGFHRTLKVVGRSSERGSVLLLVGRLVNVLVIIVAVVAIVTVLGFDTKAMLTGLGIGGVAIALAGQKTLENIIGGASLLLDKAVHVGDLCKIGTKTGIVEDIGLRSLRVRMLDQTLTIVPNGVLAQVQFESLATRMKLLIDDTFSIRVETRLEQLQQVLNSIQEMLDNDSQVERGTSRVRVVRFPGSAIELELYAYVLVGDWRTFTIHRQRIWMGILGILERLDVKLAGPTQLTYLGDRRQNVATGKPSADGDGQQGPAIATARGAQRFG